MTNQLMDAIPAIEPVLRSESEGAEQARRMSPKVMEALTAAGFFRTWVPKAYGGLEMDPLDALDVFERLAEIDPATGWVVSNSCFISTAFQSFPEPTLRAIMSNPAVLVAGSFVPPCTARAVDGGYVVNGNWTFGSAVHYASDMVALVMLVDDNGPVMTPQGPMMMAAHFPPSAVTIEDTWYTLGLRATGSHNFVVKDLFVVAEHTFALGVQVAHDAYAGPLYKLGFWIDASRIATVALGIARGALSSFLELAGSKTPAYMAAVLSDRPTVQERVAKARAHIEAGDATIRVALGDAWNRAKDGSRIQGADGVSMGLAASFGLDSAVHAVELLYECAGSTGFRDGHPFQKRFRDVQVLRGNAVASWQRYESLGKMMFGQPSDFALHNL
jgi:alkylation response protein AidB-like acyl-CoA dehydrogenase